MGCVHSKTLVTRESPRAGMTKPRRSSTEPVQDVYVASKNPSNGHVPVKEVIIPKKERPERVAGPPEPSPRSIAPKSLEGEQVAAGWPAWLATVAGEAIRGWIPRRADSFEKLDKIGQGTYSNVYKARDMETGKLVALKKVRFDNLEPESVRFMAREIEVLRRLDHPNIVKLEGLVTSRMSCSLYLVFEYMEHDLAGLAASPGVTFTEPQIKCYMKQLLSGLEHCHNRGVLHRDIKGSNLLLDNHGILKIADFGLATFYRPEQNVPLTSRVVTLWYRPPELLLGATNYGVAVDLWSSGCILAELLAGKPIMPGRTEVEQLHKIFKLCGSPSEEYWRKSRLPHATIFKPTQPYKRSIGEVFKDFPSTSLALVETLLSIEPADRGTATQALNSDFFHTKPLPCDPSSLPEYPPSKEYDAKLREEENRRLRTAGSRGTRAIDNSKRHGPSHRPGRAIPAPNANAELAESIHMQKNVTRSGAPSKSQSEKFSGSNNDHSGNQGMNMPQYGLVRRDSSPVQNLHGRGHGDRNAHISKSGPQPMVAKVSTASGPSSVWPQSKNVSGPQDIPDVRMAPPRGTSKAKSVTVPDFALQGGGFRGQGGDSINHSGHIPSNRDQFNKKVREREREKEKDRDFPSDLRKDRIITDQNTENPSRPRQPSSGDRVHHSGQLVRPSPSKEDRDLDSLLPPPPWHSSRRGHSGPLQQPQRQGSNAGGGSGSGSGSGSGGGSAGGSGGIVADKRMGDNKWVLHATNQANMRNGVVEEKNNNPVLMFPAGALPNPGTAGALAAALANDQKKYHARNDQY